MKKIKASVCILARDEEENLPRCLAALEKFEEVIVLDSGSVDKTIKIAKDWGARVVEKPWSGFGSTRISLFNEATQPWILWLDADEVVSETLVEEIENCVDMDPNVGGYLINRISYIGGKRFRHGNWYPDWNLRFFRRISWTMEERDVHESVNVQGGFGKFHSRMDHYSYRNWDERKQRAQRYAKLWASQAFRDGKRATIFDQVGHAWGCFIKGFVFKLGFLDGFSGLRLALSNSAEVSDKYRRLRKAWEKFGA